MKSVPALVVSLFAAAGVLATAGQAQAARRMFSYDPDNAPARVLADGGFTFVFEDRLMRGQRLRTILSSHDEAEAPLKPAEESDVGARLEALAGRKLEARDLYEIAQRENGAALVRAACPGADRAWLAFSALERDRDLTVEVFGHMADTKTPKHCATLKFRYRGEWRLPDALNANRATLDRN